MRDTLNRVRDLRPEPGPSAEEEVLPSWLIAVASGAGAALASATMLVVLAVLGWLTGAGGSESAGATVAAGLAGWAFAHGAPLALAEGRVGLVPWLLAGWPLLCAWWSAQRVVPDPASTSPRLRGFGGARRDVAVSGGAFVVGYVLVALVVVVGSHLGGARPSLPVAALGAAVLSTLAYVAAVIPTYRGHAREPAPRLAWAWREYVPTWTSRAIRPALTAVLATLGVGLLVVVAAVGVGIGPVLEVYARVGGGVVGATLLTLAQLAYLPTLAMWGASWLSGAGFTLGGGTEVTWAVSEPGIIPLVPVLAAVPAPGPLPGWAPLAVVLPLLVGVGLGAACVRLAERTWAGRARLTGAAVVLYGLAILVLSVAASGPVGDGRFAHVGVDAVFTSLALTGEVGLAAFVVVLLAGVRLHRAVGAGPSQTEPIRDDRPEGETEQETDVVPAAAGDDEDVEDSHRTSPRVDAAERAETRRQGVPGSLRPGRKGGRSSGRGSRDAARRDAAARDAAERDAAGRDAARRDRQ